MVKNCRTNYSRTAMGILLMVVFTWGMTAQNAENLFENHNKWGFAGQYNIFSAARVSPANTPSLRYAVPKSRRFAVGAVYNFHQHKNWNFRAGLHLQWFGNEQIDFIAKEEIGRPRDYNSLTGQSNDILLYMPVTAEYVVGTWGSFDFALGGGLGLTYFRYYGDGYGIGSKSIIENETVIGAFMNNSKTPFYTSGHLAASVYFKRKGFMLQAGLRYKKSFKSFRKGSYEFKNLQVSPDTQGSIDQSGDFWGIALTAYLRNNRGAGHHQDKEQEHTEPLPKKPKKRTLFGLKGGLNQGYIIAENKDFYSALEVYGGFFADTRLTDKFNLQNELLFSYDFDYYFIELPILLKYNIDKKWGVFLGPKYNYMFTDFPSVEGSGFKNKKFGVSATVGVQYTIFKRLFGELRYAHGLTKQIDDPFLPLPNAKRHTVRIGIGYVF